MVATVAVALPEAPDAPLQDPIENIENIEQQPMETDCSPNQEMDVSVDLPPSSPSANVASSVAAEKAKLREQSIMLDKWLLGNENNLYPTRDMKEKIATEMKMTYLQVNRWFANRRRKQTKRIKSINAQAAKAAAATEPQPQDTASVNENEKNTLKMTDEMLQSFAKVLAAASQQQSAQQSEAEQQTGSHGIDEDDKKPTSDVDEEKMHQQDRHTATPPAIEDPQQLLAQQLLNALQYGGDAQKLQTNPLLLAALCAPQYGQLLPLLQQIQSIQMQQQLQHQQLQLQQALALRQQQAMLSPQQQTTTSLTTTQRAPPTWMSPPVSASPVPVSDESVSELSDLSPRPSSPPFKDPHQLADPQLTRILNQHTQLTEKESIAVSVLAGLCMQR